MIYDRDKKCELCFMNISRYTEIYKVENVFQKNIITSTLDIKMK